MYLRALFLKSPMAAEALALSRTFLVFLLVVEHVSIGGITLVAGGGLGPVAPHSLVDLADVRVLAVLERVVLVDRVDDEVLQVIIDRILDGVSGILARAPDFRIDQLLLW